MKFLIINFFAATLLVSFLFVFPCDVSAAELKLSDLGLVNCETADPASKQPKDIVLGVTYSMEKSVVMQKVLSKMWMCLRLSMMRRMRKFCRIVQELVPSTMFQQV